MEYLDIGNIYSYSLEKLGNSGFKCPCGQIHTVETEIIKFSENALETLCDVVEALKSGHIKILFVASAEAFSLLGKSVVDALDGRGYRCKEFIFDHAVTQSVACADRILPHLDEDAMLIIGAGGGEIAELVKYTATKTGISSIFIPTSITSDSYLTPYSRLNLHGVTETFIVKPPSALICDLRFIRRAAKQNIAACYGMILSKKICLLDWYFTYILKEEKYCRELAGFVEGCIRRAADMGERLLEGSQNAVVEIFEESLKISLFSQLAVSSRLICSSPAIVANFISMLKKRGNVIERSEGENAYIAGVLLSKLYLTFFKSGQTDYLPPPDNVKRLEMLHSISGVDELLLSEKISPLLSAEAYELFVYKVKQYNADLLMECRNAERLISKNYKYFSRLYFDCGKWVGNYLSEDQIRLTLSLACDLSDKFTILTFLKDTGFLDELL